MSRKNFHFNRIGSNFINLKIFMFYSPFTKYNLDFNYFLENPSDFFLKLPEMLLEIQVKLF